MPCTPNNKRRSVIYKLQRKCLSCPYPKVSKPRWCCFHKKGSQDHAKKDNDTGLFAFWKQAWKSPFYVKAENVTAPQVVRRSKVNRLLTLFWQVAKPYWLEETKARWELGSVVALTLLQSGVSVAFSYIGRDFWNALSEKNLENFQHEIILFFTAMVVGVPIFVLYSYFREILSIHWREWLSDRILNKYFEKRGFYYLESNSQVDNPDQRIADDIRAFTNTSLQFILTFIISAVDLISFSVILFSIYPELFLVLIGYANCKRKQTFVMFWEQELAKSRLNKALSRTIDIAKLQRNLEFFTNSYRYLIQVLPAWVVSPLYFQGAIGLGVISQSISAFNHILSDLSIIVNRFEQLSQFSAGIDRLGEFLEVLEANESIGIEKDALIQRRETEDIVLQLCNISIMIPSEEPRYLIRDVNLKVERGQRLLIVGASGKGKSSLLRVIAGLWKCGSGTVRCPSLKDTCFLPQRPYCTLGSLREQLIYPKTRQQVNYTDQELIQVLEKVDLLDLFERYNDLDVVRDWSDTLSLGEQQRLAFGRLLLSRPKFVLMDEASSALDLKMLDTGLACYSIITCC
ncbi:ABC transporter D family member 2, chloroplastic [Galdieria sulphuraria]|nr:ABC transporter D family member 2, chloroplastic [Galdieria sulphuraria]